MTSSPLTRKRRSDPAPGGRRHEFATVAARLFYAGGFHGVSLSDVAAELGMTAPAVYRHFRSKQALLAGAVTAGLDVVEGAFAASRDGTLDDVFAALAAVAVAHRELWVLLQRDLRLIDVETRAPVEAQFTRFVTAFGERLRDERPDLDADDRGPIVAAVLAALSAPSLHRHSLSPLDYQRELATIAAAVARTTLPRSTGVDAPTRRRSGPPPRGEQLLDSAIGLFAARGYSAVSLDDIGAEIGIAGPSIYHHYATKADLLVSAFSRAAERLSVEDVGDVDGEPQARLTALVDRYSSVALANRALFAVYVNDAINLPKPDARRITAALAADTDDWVSTLRAARPDLSAASARLRVNAARGVVNDLVRLGRLGTRPHIVIEVRALAEAALLAG